VAHSASSQSRIDGCPGSTVGGYAVGFVTGTVGGFDRVDALENALRDCLGVPPLPGAGQ